MSYTDILMNSHVFSGLSEEQVKKLVQISEERKYSRGDAIFYEHAWGDELFILLSGKVSIKLMVVSDNDQMPIHTVLPGEVFGELAVVDSGPRSATAFCDEDINVRVIKKEAFDKLTSADNLMGMTVYRNIARIVCERIRKTNEKLINNITWGII